MKEPISGVENSCVFLMHVPFLCRVRSTTMTTGKTTRHIDVCVLILKLNCCKRVDHRLLVTNAQTGIIQSICKQQHAKVGVTAAEIFG